MLERFAAKKANNMAHTKDFVNLNAGIKGQLEDSPAESLNQNDYVGFKCLHYSVTESNGHVEITILKKENVGEYTFGVRTIEGSARKGKDYEEYKETHTIRQKETELKIHIPIIDNNEWEPDMDFYVELFDPDSLQRLSGDNTKTTVTILDEDFPGTLGFKITDLRVSKKV